MRHEIATQELSAFFSGPSKYAVAAQALRQQKNKKNKERSIIPTRKYSFYSSHISSSTEVGSACRIAQLSLSRTMLAAELCPPIRENTHSGKPSNTGKMLFFLRACKERIERESARRTTVQPEPAKNNKTASRHDGPKLPCDTLLLCE